MSAALTKAEANADALHDFHMVSVQLRERQGGIVVYAINLRTSEQSQRLNYIGGIPVEQVFTESLAAEITRIVGEHTESTELVSMADFRHRCATTTIQGALFMRHDGGIDLRFKRIIGPCQNFLRTALVLDPTTVTATKVDPDLADLCEGGLTFAQAARDEVREDPTGSATESAKAELGFYTELIKRYIKYRSKRVISR